MILAFVLSIVALGLIGWSSRAARLPSAR